MAMTSENYPGDAKRDPRAQQIMKRLHGIREQAESIRADAGATADKIVGSEPATAAGDKTLKEVPQSGFFGEVTDVISSIEGALRLASDNLRRFDREF